MEIMKYYIKPSLNYVKLRVEESLAGSGSMFFEVGYNTSEHLTAADNNWFSFWLKVLRF